MHIIIEINSNKTRFKHIFKQQLIELLFCCFQSDKSNLKLSNLSHTFLASGFFMKQRKTVATSHE